MVLHIAKRRKEYHSNQQRHLMKPNLSSLSDNEINSGKIWTLLRHNKQFEEDANWFSGRYKKATSKSVKQENREAALADCHQKYDGINKINPFAGTTLQWMFPMPLFIKENGDKAHSHPNSWGPIIWPAKGDEIDVLKEWKEYEASKQWLTLETDWFSINKGFKRALLHQYRQIDLRPLNPLTKDRSDAPFPHETDFFKDLDLVGLIQKGQLTEEGLGKVLHANELKSNYTVFAIPKQTTSKKAVDEAFQPIIKSVKESLPNKAVERFGTIAEWMDFMAVKEVQKQNNIPSLTKAIHDLIKKRHLNKKGVTMREARRSYEKGIRENFDSINKKIEAVYPVFLV
jgi:hypothetical protein